MCPQPRIAPRCHVICFPCAAGGVGPYYQWSGDLPDQFQLWGVQMPGRDQRLRDPLVQDMSELMTGLVPALVECADRSLIFFGHSAGAYVALEAARQLEREHNLVIDRLIVAGSNAPQTGAPLHYGLGELSDKLFLAEIRNLGGTPPQVLEHPELLALFLPIMRADIRLAENYRVPLHDPIAAPITALRGEDDWHTGEDAMRRWGELTRGDFRFHNVPGDHFFPYRSRRSLCHAIDES